MLRRDQWDSLISGMSLTRVCIEINFLNIQIIGSQLCLWISIFRPQIQITLSFSSSIVVKTEASSKKCRLRSNQGNKIRELKFIQCTIKVSFQGQSNPQKYKNPNKITSFFVNYIYLKCLLHTVLPLNIDQPEGLFQKSNILWHAQHSQWVQNSIFPNGKFIFPYSFLVKNT